MQHSECVTVGYYDYVTAHVDVEFMDFLQMDLDRFGVDQLARQVVDVKKRQNALVQGVRGMPNETAQHRGIDVNGQNGRPGQPDNFGIVGIGALDLNGQFQHKLKNKPLTILTRHLDKIIIKLLAPETTRHQFIFHRIISRCLPQTLCLLPVCFLFQIRKLVQRLKVEFLLVWIVQVTVMGQDQGLLRCSTLRKVNITVLGVSHDVQLSGAARFGWGWGVSG